MLKKFEDMLFVLTQFTNVMNRQTKHHMAVGPIGHRAATNRNTICLFITKPTSINDRMYTSHKHGIIYTTRGGVYFNPKVFRTPVRFAPSPKNGVTLKLRVGVVQGN